MSSPKRALPVQPDLLLDIDVRGGEAALLRVVATLHQRHARVRSLTYDGTTQEPRLQVRIDVAAPRRGHLVGALGRCVDVLRIRCVPALEGAAV